MTAPAVEDVPGTSAGTMDADTVAAILDAIDELFAPESRVVGRLRDALAAEGRMGRRGAYAVARRFCAAVNLSEQGMSDDQVAAELGCSVSTLEMDRRHVQRLAHGTGPASVQLADDLCGGEQG
jgi:hypothetical protein